MDTSTELNYFYTAPYTPIFKHSCNPIKTKVLSTQICFTVLTIKDRTMGWMARGTVRVCFDGARSTA